jgi:serine/threonine protein kinase
MKDLKWASWMFQIVAALSEAQYYYGFVHNDLHTHNVMFENTEIENLHYKVVKSGIPDQYFTIPTFGKIMKIIDFGRASFTLPETHGGFYISDAFFEGNDAAEQYNCEPFYDPSNGPKLEPNPSFDLCRLSVSLIESLFPTKPEASSPVKVMNKEGSKIYTETISPVYNLLWSWLLDDKQQNVMRLPNGRERYPSFDLYKKIASEVHGAVPVKQIFHEAFLCFKQEVEPELQTNEKMYTIHIV